MKFLQPFGSLIAVSLLVSGCNVIPKEKYEGFQVELRNNPKFRAQKNKECRNSVSALKVVDRENLAALANVDPSNAATVICNRIERSLVSGRITYADYLAARKNGNYAAMIKSLQGR